jgi:fermentation-respiration switch protein FrsA (DUF1100 family)
MKTWVKRWVVGELSWRRWLRSLVIVYAMLLGYGCLCTDRLIFPRPPVSYRDDPGVIKITSADGTRLSARWLPNPEARYTLLYTHGNYEDLGELAPMLEYLRELGFSVFSYDYRGYGTSEGGTPRERDIYADQRAAFRHLVDVLGVPASNVIAHGRSVGCAAAVDLATREPLAGLVVESGFVSAFRVQTHIPLLPIDKFRNLARMPRVRCPVLVLHGTADRVIPTWHGRKLYAAAPGPKTNLWVAGAGHNDLVSVAGADYGKALRAFAASLGGNRKPEP